MSQCFDSIEWSTNEELFDLVKTHEFTKVCKTNENFTMWRTHPNAIAWFQNTVKPGHWYTEHQKVVYVPGKLDSYEVCIVARFNEYYDIQDFTIICRKNYDQELIVPATRRVWEYALKLACKDCEPFQGSIVLPIQLWKFVIDEITYTITSYDGGAETRIKVEFDTEDDLIKYELPQDLKYVSREFDINGNDLINYWRHTRRFNR